MTWLKDWWPVITGFFLAALGMGDLRRRVKDLESGNFVKESTCELERKGCQKNYDTKFTFGEQQFEEIKTLIDKKFEEVKDLLRDGGFWDK